jgi:predicted metal-dependent enzyme (double-stranded beta helix superfamily)
MASVSQLSRRSFLAGAAGLLVAGAAHSRDEREGHAVKFDVDQFVDDIKHAKAEVDSQTAVQEVLARAVSDPNAVISGIGAPTEAGIHTIFQGKDLTILNVVWAPLMLLLPHNHSMWASTAIYTGREDNIIWQRSGSTVEASRAASLSEREVFPLPEDAIHSVTNPIERLTGAIHVYGGDFFGTPRSEWDAETLIERPFDLEAARRTFKESNERFRASRSRE